MLIISRFIKDIFFGLVGASLIFVVSGCGSSVSEIAAPVVVPLSMNDGLALDSYAQWTIMKTSCNGIVEDQSLYSGANKVYFMMSGGTAPLTVQRDPSQANCMASATLTATYPASNQVTLRVTSSFVNTPANCTFLTNYTQANFIKDFLGTPINPNGTTYTISSSDALGNPQVGYTAAIPSSSITLTSINTMSCKAGGSGYHTVVLIH